MINIYDSKLYSIKYPLFKSKLEIEHCYNLFLYMFYSFLLCSKSKMVNIFREFCMIIFPKRDFLAENSSGVLKRTKSNVSQ